MKLNLFKSKTSNNISLLAIFIAFMLISCTIQIDRKNLKINKILKSKNGDNLEISIFQQNLLAAKLVDYEGFPHKFNDQNDQKDIVYPEVRMQHYLNNIFKNETLNEFHIFTFEEVDVFTRMYLRRKIFKEGKYGEIYNAKENTLMGGEAIYYNLEKYELKSRSKKILTAFTSAENKKKLEEKYPLFAIYQEAKAELDENDKTFGCSDEKVNKDIREYIDKRVTKDLKNVNNFLQKDYTLKSNIDFQTLLKSKINKDFCKNYLQNMNKVVEDTKENKQIDSFDKDKFIPKLKSVIECCGKNKCDEKLFQELGGLIESYEEEKKKVLKISLYNLRYGYRTVKALSQYFNEKMKDKLIEEILLVLNNNMNKDMKKDNTDNLTDKELDSYLYEILDKESNFNKTKNEEIMKNEKTKDFYYQSISEKYATYKKNSDYETLKTNTIEIFKSLIELNFYKDIFSTFFFSSS